MQNIIDFLNSLGFNENTNPIVLIALGYLIFTCIILISVVNISIYLVSLYIVNNNKLIDKISSKFPYVIKIVNLYNRTRISFIILELVILLGSIGYMLYTSIRIIVNLS